MIIMKHFNLFNVLIFNKFKMQLISKASASKPVQSSTNMRNS